MKRAFTSPEELEKLVDEYFSKCSATEEQLHLKNGDVRIRRTLPSIVGLAVHLGIAKSTLLLYAEGKYDIDTTKGDNSNGCGDIQSYSTVLARVRDRIELDVQMTADGKVVVVHDFNLKRISGVDKEIDQCTYEELQDYPIYGSDQRVPLFEDVLKAVDGKVPLIVELKYKEGSKICEKAQEILNGYTGIYCIESFHPQVLVWYRKNYPHICRGQLSMNFERDENTKGAQYFALRHLLTNFLAKPDFIAYDCRAMHAVSKNICRNLFGCPSVAWTVKCQAQLDACSRSFDYFIFEGFAPKQ